MLIFFAQGDPESRWITRQPANAAGNNGAPGANPSGAAAATAAGRGSGGGRRGRKKKSVGITIKEAGGQAETHASNTTTTTNVVAEGAVEREQRELQALIEAAEGVYTMNMPRYVGGISINEGGRREEEMYTPRLPEVQGKGKEKVGETVQMSRKGKEKVVVEDFDMDLMMNWPEYYKSMDHDEQTADYTHHPPPNI